MKLELNNEVEKWEAQIKYRKQQKWRKTSNSTRLYGLNIEQKMKKLNGKPYGWIMHILALDSLYGNNKVTFICLNLQIKGNKTRT